MISFSRPLQLREWRQYVTRDQRGKLKPFAHTAEIKDKWLYVLRSADGAAFAAIMEVWVAAPDQLTPIALTGSQEREQRQAPSTLTAQSRLTLPNSIGTSTTRHAFFLSRIRLSARAIDALASDAANLLPSIDLADETQLVFQDDGPTSGDGAFLPVIDPLTVAEIMNEEYAARLAALVKHVAQPAPGQQISEVCAKRFVGGILERVLQGDPNDALQLKDHFKGGAAGVSSMRKELAKLREQENVLNLAFEAAGARLVDWLASPLFELTSRSYEDYEREDYGIFITSTAKYLQRLSYCSAGRRHILALIDANAHIIASYVLPQDPLGKVQAETLQNLDGAAAKLFELWTETSAPILSSKQYDEALKLLASRFNNLFGRGLASPQPLVVMHDFELNIAKIQLNTALKDGDWAPWVKNTNQVRTGTVNFLKVFTGVLAVRAMLDNNTSAFARTSAGLTAVSGAVELLAVARNAFVEIGPLALSRIAAAGALLGVASSTFSVMDAASLDDGNTALGHSISAFGSGIALAGLIAGSSGIGAIPGAVLVFSGVIVGLAGWLVTVLGADSPLQTFVAHSFWGEDFGSGSGKPKWAGGALSAWKQNPERMVNALMDVLFGFAVKVDGIDGDIAVGLRFGVIFQGSKVSLSWKVRDDHERRWTVEQSFDLESGASSIVSSSVPLRPGTPRVRFERASAGEPATLRVVAPRREFRAGEPLSTTYEDSVAVRLVVGGGQPPRTIPSSGALIAINLRSLAGWPTGDGPFSSADY